MIYARGVKDLLCNPRYAETVLRPVVRYLSTTPALGSGDPAAFSEAFRMGVAATHPSWAHLFSPDESDEPLQPASGDRGSAGP